MTPSLSTSLPDLFPPDEDAVSYSTGGAASLLRRYHNDLVERWVLLLRDLQGSNYSLRPLEELYGTCGECLSAYEALLDTGDTEPLWQFIERVCRLRAALQFPPSEITEAFMLFLEAADETFGPKITDREAWSGLMRDLRRCTRQSLKAWVNAYLIQLEIG